MKKHTLRKPTATTYGIACNPLTDTYHQFEIGSNSRVDSGQPVVIYGATKADVFNQLFSEWTVDADGNLDTYTPHAATLSIDYTEADALQTAADAMEIIGGLMIRPIKHPSRDEWAMFVSPQLLNRAAAGAAKDALIAKHLDKVNTGKNKTKPQAVAEGWN